MEASEKMEMINAQRLLEEFMELVKIDSISKKERKIADVLREKLMVIGLTVTEDGAGKEIGAEAGNLIAKLPATKSGVPTILLSAHMDTVVPGENIVPVFEDGRIYTKGETILGSDDKAGIAAILEALRQVKEKQIPHGEIEIVFSIAEELGLQGTKKLDYSLLKAKIGFVFDSSGAIGTIVTQAPAQDNLTAVIRGRSAHAGFEPEHGISAIQIASKAIAKMRLGRIDHETTANIGSFRGGVATNIVPDYVEIKGEARSRDEQKLKEQINHMVDAFRQSAEEFGGKVELQIERLYPAFNLRPESRAVQLALQAARKVHLEPILQSSGGGSDANIFNGQGIECVNLSVGMQKVHTTDEFIRVVDLNKAAAYVLAIIETAANA